MKSDIELLFFLMQKLVLYFNTYELLTRLHCVRSDDLWTRRGIELRLSRGSSVGIGELLDKMLPV